MMRTLRFGFALVVVVGVTVSAADWPQWRGPHGSGIADDKDLPEQWSATENVAWKARLGGVGASSPIVAGNTVVVTSQIGTGVSRQGPRLAQGTDAAGSASASWRGIDLRDKVVFLVEAFSRATDDGCGNTGWKRGPLQPVHDKHNLASPSPVTDGQRVYAWFGTGQVVALDMSGEVVWQRHIGQRDFTLRHQLGPFELADIVQDAVILLCDHAPASYLLAVDKRTGKDRWKADRGKGRSSYTTPFVVPGEQWTRARRQLQRTRRRLRSAKRHAPVARGRIKSVSDPGADIQQRHHLSDPRISKRSVHGGKPRRPRRRLGVACRVAGAHRRAVHLVARVRHRSAVHGERRRRHLGHRRGDGPARMARAGQRPVLGLAGGRRREGLFRQRDRRSDRAARGAQPKVIARNDMGERLMASPAISNGQIFLRSDGSLFAIGKPRG